MYTVRARGTDNENGKLGKGITLFLIQSLPKTDEYNSPVRNWKYQRAVLLTNMIHDYFAYLNQYSIIIAGTNSANCSLKM